jgi:hypothetical protein
MYYIVFRNNEEKVVKKILKHGLEVDDINQEDIFKDISALLSAYKPNKVIIIEVDINSDIKNKAEIAPNLLKRYTGEKEEKTIPNKTLSKVNEEYHSSDEEESHKTSINKSASVLTTQGKFTAKSLNKVGVPNKTVTSEQLENAYKKQYRNGMR